MNNYTIYDFGKNLIDLCLFVIFFSCGYGYGNKNSPFFESISYMGIFYIIGTIIGLLLARILSRKLYQQRDKALQDLMDFIKKETENRIYNEIKKNNE